MRHQVKVFTLISFLFLISESVFAQTSKAVDRFSVRSAAFYLPATQPAKTFKHIIGLADFFLPSDWTNVNLNAPMLNYSARYYVPANFSVDASIHTLYVANKFTMGLNWNHSFNEHLHAGISYSGSYNLGILHDDYQFATIVTALTYSPSIAIGYSTKETAFTLRGGIEHLDNVYFKTGSNVVKDHYSFINGAFLKITMEQRLWKHHVLSFGVEIDRMQFVIVAWPAYPVNNKRYTIPQVTLGITL